MMKNSKKMMIAAAVLTMAVLTGCGGSDPGSGTGGSKAPKTGESVSVSVVVGAHSNANVISPNAKVIADKVYQCTYTYGTVSLIRADGKPEEFLKATIEEPSTKGLSDRKLKSLAEDKRDQILAAFNTNGMAKYEEVDTLDAIRLAANSLKSAETDEKYLVVADPGLSTTGYLNFCKDDLFHTDTADIVAVLVDEKAIPDLEGVNVLWMYAGQTAEPQERLSEVQKAKLIEIWTAVLEQAGAASYDFSVDSASSTAYTDLPSVSVVPADERVSDITPLQTVVLDSENVSFVGDQAVFVDEEQAKKAIGNVAQTLLDHPQNSVYVVGCTASAAGKEDFCQTLSAARASAVVELLKNFGVPAEQMKAVGMGSQAPWHVPDLDASGHQIEEYAKQNRCVVILDTLDPEYGEVVASCF